VGRGGDGLGFAPGRCSQLGGFAPGRFEGRLPNWHMVCAAKPVLAPPTNPAPSIVTACVGRWPLRFRVARGEGGGG